MSILRSKCRSLDEIGGFHVVEPKLGTGTPTSVAGFEGTGVLDPGIVFYIPRLESGGSQGLSDLQMVRRGRRRSFEGCTYWIFGVLRRWLQRGNCHI